MEMTVRAIKLTKPGGLDNLKLADIEVAEPQCGEIRIRNHASSLNFHDYVVAIGLLPVDDGRIPMSDGAGVVEAVGAGVTEFKPGDKVMSCFFPHWADGRADSVAKLGGVPGDNVNGFAAETVTMAASAFTLMPDGYTFEQAATLPCAAATAWRALMVEAKIKPGDTVLVQGSGGVSVFALQFAKAAGCHVIATSSSDAKLERLKALGADTLINYRQFENWGDKVLEITAGSGECDCRGGWFRHPATVRAGGRDGRPYLHDWRAHGYTGRGANGGTIPEKRGDQRHYSGLTRPPAGYDQSHQYQRDQAGNRPQLRPGGAGGGVSAAGVATTLRQDLPQLLTSG
jgi:NADPH:quinone reductase-like Zn-dependent oxidoreductase